MASSVFRHQNMAAEPSAWRLIYCNLSVPRGVADTVAPAILEVHAPGTTWHWRWKLRSD